MKIGKRTAIAGFLAGGVVFLLFLASPVSGGRKNLPPGDQSSFAQPVRLSFDSSGNLLVSDFTRQMVFTLDRNSLQLTDFCEIGKIKDNSNRKEGRPMAVGQRGNLLFVGNASSSRVEVRDAARSDNILYYLGGKTADSFIKKPTDLAVDQTTGQVFVLDGMNKVVRVFAADGALLQSIPNDPSLLKNPTAIALDEARQEVFVSDFGSSSSGPAVVHILSYTGEEVAGGISGEQSGFQFSRPMGLAVDPRGAAGGGTSKIFVVDGVLGQVLVFDRATLGGVAKIGKFGTNPGELFSPTDVVVDNGTKDVFVISASPARVEVFRKGGLFP